MVENINIRKLSITAVMWGSFGSGARILLQMIAQIVLVRLLGPDQYGLFAIGAVVVSFSVFFSDIGIAYGLIQKKSVKEEDVRFIFTWQLILGLIVAFVVFWLAKPLADFFTEPRIVPIIKWLSLVCLINAVTAPSLNILKRNLDFKSIHLAQVVSYTCGYILVGIPLAFAGQQVKSLVTAWMIQASINFILLYWRTRHSLKFLFWFHDSRSLSTYGITVFATNWVNWLTNNIDRVIVGRMFASTAVGLYTTSYNLVNTPTSTILGVLQSSLFSASARVQGDTDRLRNAFLTVSGTLALLVAPVFVGIAVVSETVVGTLYGNAWLHSADTLRPLALAMPLFLLIGMATPMLWTSGQTTKELKIQIPVAAMWIIASYFGAQYSVSAVAWIVFSLFIFRASIVIKATGNALKIGLVEFINVLKGGVIVSVIVAIVLALTDTVIRCISDTPIVWLLSDITSAALGLIVPLKLFPILIAPEVATLIRQLVKPMPPRIAAWVLRLACGVQLP
jgi:O-antigen/teichoic acid export membrane protein